MIYLYLLVIRAYDWPDKINLAVMDREPTEEEKKSIIENYWQQYEKGMYEDFKEFYKYLETSVTTENPYKKGIWIERIALLAKKERLIGMLDDALKKREEPTVHDTEQHP